MIGLLKEYDCQYGCKDGAGFIDRSDFVYVCERKSSEVADPGDTGGDSGKNKEADRFEADGSEGGGGADDKDDRPG